VTESFQLLTAVWMLYWILKLHPSEQQSWSVQDYCWPSCCELEVLRWVRCFKFLL